MTQASRFVIVVEMSTDYSNMTEEQWKTLTPREKLDAAMECSGITSVKEFSRFTGFDEETIRGWRHKKMGRSYDGIGSVSDKILKRYVLGPDSGEIRDMMAIYSVGRTTMDRFVYDRSYYSEPMMTAMAAHHLVLKLASMLDVQFPPGHLLMKISMLYQFPMPVLLEVKTTKQKFKNTRVTLEIHPPITEGETFRYVLSILKRGVVSTLAMAASDKASLRVVSLIKKAFGIRGGYKSPEIIEND